MKNIIGETAGLEAFELTKTRVLMAAILLPLLLIVVLALPKVYTAILFALMAAIGAYELLYSTGYIKHPRLVAYAMIAAFAVSIWSYAGMQYAWGLLGLMCLFTALFVEMMFSHVKLRFETAAVCMVAGIVIPFLLCSLVRIHAVEGTGRYFIMIPFVLAFLSDTGAYFIGCKFGKHKLAPAISPKKSIEGVVGGFAGAVLGMLIYGIVLQFAFGFQVNYLYCIVYGVLGSLAGTFGDLCFSVIKRQTGLKDFGNLIPGHGGILDRFDSMMVVGPIVEILLILLPVAVK